MDRWLGACLLMMWLPGTFCYGDIPDYGALPVSKDAGKQLARQWGHASASSSPLKIVGRAVARPVKRLLVGKIGQQMLSTVKIPYDALKKPSVLKEKVYKSVVGSLLNPLVLGSHLVSDVGGAAQSVKSARWRTSSRIMTCAMKFPLPLPFEHIFYVVDHGDLHNDFFDQSRLNSGAQKVIHKNQDAAYCFATPIKSKDSPSIAIERLNCMAHIPYHASYALLSYNCGGMTRKVLKSSKLGFPDLSNLGIGSNISKVPESVNAQVASQVKVCERYVDDIRQLIYNLEAATKVDPAIVARVLKLNPRKDTVTQLAISAARGGNPDNLKLMTSRLSGSGKIFGIQFYGSHHRHFGKSGAPKIGSHYKSMLKRMIRPLDAKTRDVVSESFPELEPLVRHPKLQG